MSKTQDGFLGKVSKGIKKSIYDDEPDAASGKLIIGCERDIQFKCCDRRNLPNRFWDQCVWYCCQGFDGVMNIGVQILHIIRLLFFDLNDGIVEFIKRC